MDDREVLLLLLDEDSDDFLLLDEDSDDFIEVMDSLSLLSLTSPDYHDYVAREPRSVESWG